MSCIKNIAIREPLVDNVDAKHLVTEACPVKVFIFILFDS